MSPTHSPQSYWGTMPLASYYSLPHVLTSMSALVRQGKRTGVSQTRQTAQPAYFATRTTNSSGPWTNVSSGVNQQRKNGGTTSSSTESAGLSRRIRGGGTATATRSAPVRRPFFGDVKTT